MVSLVFIVSRLIFIVLGVEILTERYSTYISWPYRVFSTSVEALILIDYISSFFIGTVILISRRVILFSHSYIYKEKFFLRFHLLLILFIFCIVILIVSTNLIRIILGWDGLGVTSFLLVVYFQNKKSFNAGMLTALTNRLGDFFLLFSISLSMKFGHWDLFSSVDDIFNINYLSSVWFVFFAALTKRAQIPFSAWLPAAMAAPTPVSALVHSSTLVTAGIYLLIRIGDWVIYSYLGDILIVLGLLTSFIARIRAIYEKDIKKIVALSTLSQLGLMVFSVRLQIWELTLAHLIAHAFSKAILFLAVGSIIHTTEDYQDSRKASLCGSFSLSLTVRALSNLSLCGMPFLACFYSKDWVLEISLINIQIVLSTTLISFTTFFTSLYSFKFIFISWFSTCRMSCMTWETKDYEIWIAFFILRLATLFIGSIVLIYLKIFKFPTISVGIKTSTLIIIFLGAIGGYFFSIKINNSKKLDYFFWSLGSMWSLSFISSFFIIKISSFSINKIMKLDVSWIWKRTLNSLLGKSLFIYLILFNSKVLRFLWILISFIVLILIIII